MKKETLEQAKELLQALLSAQDAVNDANEQLIEAVGSKKSRLNKLLEHDKAQGADGSLRTALGKLESAVSHTGFTLYKTEGAAEDCNEAITYLRVGLQQAVVEEEVKKLVLPENTPDSEVKDTDPKEKDTNSEAKDTDPKEKDTDSEAKDTDPKEKDNPAPSE